MTIININEEYEIQYDTVEDSLEKIYQVALIHIPSRETITVMSADYNNKALYETIEILKQQIEL